MKADRISSVLRQAGYVLLLTFLCIIEVRFFVSSEVLKSPPERKAAKR